MLHFMNEAMLCLWSGYKHCVPVKIHRPSTFELFFFYFQKTENTRKFNIESEILLFFWQSPVNYQWAGTLGKAERQRPTLARATISLRKSPDVSDIISFSSSVLYTRKQKILFQLKVSYKYLITRTVPDDCSMHSNI